MRQNTARPDLWGARVSNDPGLPDLEKVRLERLVSGTFGVIRVVNDLQTGQ